MTPISTGYQPEFGLGALYQGFNAANADKLNEEEVLKAFLQNQKDIREAPLNQIMKQWEAKQAEGKMNDPDFLAKMLEGYKGQMNSQIAAGNKGMRTWESDADATVQENKNKLFMGKILEDWNKLRLKQQIQQSQEDQEPTATINRIPDQWGGEGLQKGSPITWSGPWGGNTNKANALSAFTGWRGGALGNISKESNMVKSFGLESESQPPVFSNMVQEQPQEQGQAPQNNLLARMQNILVNTPEHLQKMEQLNTKGDYSLEAVKLRNEGMLANARAKASQIVKDPKYTDIVAKAILIDADPDATPKDKARAARIIQLYTKIEVVKRSAGQVPGLNLAGTQETGKPVMGTTPAREFMENPEMLTGDSTRRKEAQAQRGVATGQVSSGNKFKVERTD